MHAITRTMAELQTKFQHAEIMETPAYGKLLVLDGRIQSSQAEDFIYHEALVHPGMLACDRAPESGLVIGGGEGATLREILRYPSVRRGVMVDIDGEVVELCKKHLPEMHQGVFDDPRTQSPQVIDKLISERLPSSTLGYWDGLTHQHAFSLPKHIRAAIDAQTRIITDAHPLIVV